MGSVLEACNPETYEYLYGQLEWEIFMAKEYGSFMKNKTRDLVPQQQGNNLVKCMYGSTRLNLHLKVLLRGIKLDR